jgi:hypothetical protein
VEPTTYTDAICGETLTEEIDEILVLTVSRRAGSGRQELFVHRDCLVRVLRPEIPLGEVFELE